MASHGIVGSKRPLEEPEDAEFEPAKKFKTSELPLNSTQRSAVDSLVHTIKKKGIYDTLRKQVWAQYAASAEKAAFTNSLEKIAEAEIDREPSLLSRDRSKAATLIQGAVDRSDIYKVVEQSLDDLIAKNISAIEEAARDIRKADVGEEVAAEEKKRGQKTDEEYAKEAGERSEARAKVRKQEEARKRREEEKEALRAESNAKMKELEQLRSAEARRQEREAARAERKESEAERRALLNRTKENPPREGEKDKQRVESGPRDGERSDNGTVSNSTPAAKLVDEKAIEEAALALLLQEGRELAAKNGSKPEQDFADSREPPHRQAHISIPRGPAADRHKFAPRPEHSGSKLGYSSTAVHRASPIPAPKSATPRGSSRSPHRQVTVSQHRDHPRPSSPNRDHSRSHRNEENSRQAEFESKEAYKKDMMAKRTAESDAYKRSRYERDEAEHRSRSQTRDREREKERSKYRDYDKSRERRPEHHDEKRSSTRDRLGEKDIDTHRYDEHSSTRYRERSAPRDYYESRSDRPKPRTDEPPDHIDRYVPGSGSTREKTREKDVDRAAHRDYRKKRSDYDDHDRDRDRGRDRDHYDKYKSRDQDKYASKDRDRDDRDHREKERDTRDYPSKDRKEDRYRDDSDRERSSYSRSSKPAYDDRSSKSTYDDHASSSRAYGDARGERRGGRRDTKPEHIDRYQPGDGGERGKGRDGRERG